MEGIRKTEKGVLLAVRVKAGSGQFSISSEGGFLTIRTKNPAENNKANLEILKELSRLFGKNVRILRGLKSRSKEILVEGISAAEAGRLLER